MREARSFENPVAGTTSHHRLNDLCLRATRARFSCKSSLRYVSGVPAPGRLMYGSRTCVALSVCKTSNEEQVGCLYGGQIERTIPDWLPIVIRSLTSRHRNRRSRI